MGFLKELDILRPYPAKPPSSAAGRAVYERLRELLDDSARSNLGAQPSVGDAAREAIAGIEAQPGEPTD